MKRSSAELKKLARETLKGKYGTLIGTAMISGLIAFGASLAITMATFGVSGQRALIIQMCLNFVLTFVWMIFEAGIIYQAMQACRGKTIGIKDLFYGFTNKPMRYIVLALLMSLIFIVLLLPFIILLTISLLVGYNVASILVIGSLLFYMVGLVFIIIISYGLSLCYYLLIDNPDMTAIESIKTSWKLMKGNKGRFFYLSLSFIGLSLLAVISCGISLLWTVPYINVTTAFFYFDVIGALDPPPVTEASTASAPPVAPVAPVAPVTPVTPVTPVVPVAPPIDPMASAQTVVEETAPISPVKEVATLVEATTPNVPLTPIITPQSPTNKKYTNAPYVDDPVIHTPVENTEKGVGEDTETVADVKEDTTQVEE